MSIAEMIQRKGKRKATSKYLGVYVQEGKRFIANVRGTHLGSFSCEDEAALAYNYGAELLIGEDAVLNVIPDSVIIDLIDRNALFQRIYDLCQKKLQKEANRGLSLAIG